MTRHSDAQSKSSIEVDPAARAEHASTQHQADPRVNDRLLRLCVGCLAAWWVVIAFGCTSTIRVSDPPRTATEQFLLSKAAAAAVDQLSVDGLRGRRVFLDSEYFAASEAAFVLGELRAKLLHGGVELMRERDAAQIILEVRSGGVGIDRSDFLIGIPSVLVRAGGDDTATTVPVATPELALVKNINQVGVASVAFIAYWADTGEVVAASGPYIGRTLREDWWFFGFGPRTVGNIPTTDPIE